MWVGITVGLAVGIADFPYANLASYVVWLALPLGFAGAVVGALADRFRRTDAESMHATSHTAQPGRASKDHN